jgi:hypothetical protein
MLEPAEYDDTSIAREYLSPQSINDLHVLYSSLAFGSTGKGEVVPRGRRGRTLGEPGARSAKREHASRPASY